MIDVAAGVLGRRPPAKLSVSTGLLRAISPLAERLGKMPSESLSGFLDSLAVEDVGDPAPIRALLPRAPVSYRTAVEQAVAGDG